MIVVDTNTIIYLCLPGEHTQEVEKVFEKDPEWVSPRLWKSEFLNVLSFYLRQGTVSFQESVHVVERAWAVVQSKSEEASPIDILELTSKSCASAYDCEFVALAKKLRLPLITSDKAILKLFPGVAVSPKNYLTDPK